MLKHPMQRRAFLKGIAMSGIYSISAVARAQGAADIQCLAQESGRCAEWPLVVSVLFTDAPQQCNDRIESIRVETGYSKPMKFSETGVNEARERFFKEVFAYFAEEPSVWLRALIITDDLGQWPDVANQRDARYFAKYKYVLESGIGDEFDNPAIYIPKQNDPRNEQLELKLKAIAPFVVRTEPPLGNLAQLARFFATAIRAEKSGEGSKWGGLLLNDLKTTLGTTDLTQLDSEKAIIVSTNI